MADQPEDRGYYTVKRQRWTGNALQLAIAIISLGIGYLAGGINNYVGLQDRTSAMAATVRVQGDEIAMLKEAIENWRNEDKQLIGNVQTQLADVSSLLTDLRVRLGPKYR
jgi:cell division protein FtsB